jgi:hypothetical protein
MDNWRFAKTLAQSFEIDFFGSNKKKIFFRTQTLVKRMKILCFLVMNLFIITLLRWEKKDLKNG